MFKYNGNRYLIKECVFLANELLMNKSFHDKIRSSSFDMSTCSGVVIDDDINKYIVNNDFYERISIGEEMNIKSNYLLVEIYKSKNPWSSAYGYFSPSNPNSINLNSRKLNRSKGSIVSSLIHEMIHYCDDRNKGESYGHGDNSSVGKENTAPYSIDNIAESFIDGKPIDYNNLENNEISYYVPWWKKVLRIFS